MVDNQHQKIQGYRDLTQDDIDLMNKFKDFEQNLADHVNDYLTELGEGRSESHRQIALAKTNFEEGFMHLIRSIAKPISPWVQ